MSDIHKHRARLPLPTVVNPEGRRCVTLEIPDDMGHITAFWGYLWGLTRWYTWDSDPDKTGKDIAGVWRTVYENGRENFYSCLEAPETGIFEAPCTCIMLSNAWKDVIISLLERGLKECAWCKTEGNAERGIEGIDALIDAMTDGNCGKRLTGLYLDANGNLVAVWDEGGEAITDIVGMFMGHDPVLPETLEDLSPQYTCFAITEMLDDLKTLYLWYVEQMRDVVSDTLELSQAVIGWVDKIFFLGIDVGGIESQIEQAEAFILENLDDLEDDVNNPDWYARVRCDLFLRIQENEWKFTEEIWNTWISEDVHFDTPPLEAGTDFDEWIPQNIKWDYIARRFALSLADETEENECELCGCETTWEHEFDFTLSDGGFSAFENYAVYDPGLGWKDNNSGLIIYKAISPTEIRYAECSVDTSQYFGVYFRATQGGENIASVDGTGTHIQGTLGADKVVGWFYINGSYPPGGHITYLKLTGCGSDPFL